MKLVRICGFFEAVSIERGRAVNIYAMNIQMHPDSKQAGCIVTVE